VSHLEAVTCIHPKEKLQDLPPPMTVTMCKPMSMEVNCFFGGVASVEYLPPPPPHSSSEELRTPFLQSCCSTPPPLELQTAKRQALLHVLSPPHSSIEHKGTSIPCCRVSRHAVTSAISMHLHTATFCITSSAGRLLPPCTYASRLSGRGAGHGKAQK